MARIKFSPVLTEISGSVGSSTFQRSLGGFSLKQKNRVKPNQSVLQTLIKVYIAQCIAAWQNLTNAQRTEWNKYAEFNTVYQKFNKGKRLNGYNLFVKYNCIRLMSGLSILSGATFIDSYNPDYSTEIYTVNENFFVAVGEGTNTIAYSSNGISWTGIGTSIFSSEGRDVCWNGSIFVAVGIGTNNIAYSSNGVSWSPGSNVFSTGGYGVCWNGSKFVAVGSGANTIGFSYTGTTAWYGLGAYIFTGYGYGVCWNGTMFVAVGNGTNTIAYSYDGINWVGLGETIFTTTGFGVCWNGHMFVAVGIGTNTLAYSYDGINWIGLGATLFTFAGYSVCWDGSKFVAVGRETNTIAYSYDGVNWTGLGTSIFSTKGTGICWNGKKFVATGQGTNTLAYSSNGLDWTGVGTSIFSSTGDNVCSQSAPQLVPVINHALIFDFNYDLYTNDYWVLLKLSNARRPSEGFRSNTTRIVLLTYASGEYFDITDAFYSLFGKNPFAGDLINVEFTIFSVETARIFPIVREQIEITATYP